MLSIFFSDNQNDIKVPQFIMTILSNHMTDLALEWCSNCFVLIQELTNFLSRSYLTSCILVSSCSGYRALYILNWIYRYFTQPHFVHWICIPSLSVSVCVCVSVRACAYVCFWLICLVWMMSPVKLRNSSYSVNWKCWFSKLCTYSCRAAWVSGLVQTLLYADFFYYYFQR